MFQGPSETLTLTENAQPALLAVGYAAYRAYLEAGGATPPAAAGHSLGEWTAHVAAGTLALEDALRLVRLRGRFMQEAVPPDEGAMAAVLKLPLAAIEEALDGLAGVWIANLNAPGQTVISGQKPAVLEAARRLPDGLYVFARVEEEELAQDVLLEVRASTHGVYAGLRRFGDVIVTPGVRQAVAALVGWLEEAGLTVKKRSY
jgi:malonyl CoA-acyl carrier protein transacylase